MGDKLDEIRAFIAGLSGAEATIRIIKSNFNENCSSVFYVVYCSN